jgi:hypothetical protein
VTWETFTQLTQIATLGAVIIAIIYLARQIRQNTNSVRESSAQAIADSFHRLNGLVAADASLARVFSKGCQDLDQLGPEERVRFDFFVLSAFRTFERLFYQSQLGRRGAALREADQETMRSLLIHPGMRAWWHDNTLSFAPEFRSLVEGMMETAGEDKSWAI